MWPSTWLNVPPLVARLPSLTVTLEESVVTVTRVKSLSVMLQLVAVVFTEIPALPLVIGETSVTVTVSVGSTRASLITGIVIVAVVVLAGIVTECVMAV